MSAAPRQPNLIRLGLVGGTARYYGVQVGRDGQASRLRATPQQAYGQLTTIGDTAQVSDQRTSSLIFGFGGTLGRDKYQETEGIQDVRYTEWDTRFEDSGVLPLAATGLGTGPGFTFAPVYVDWLGAAGADLLAWVPYSDIAGASRYQSGSWTTLTDSGGGSIISLTGLTRYRGAFYLTSLKGVGAALYRSTTGTTWTSTGPVATIWYGSCVHDNKWYGYDAVSAKVWHTLDPTQPAGAAWVTSNEALDLKYNEYVIQLAEWEDDTRHKCVMLATTHRLLRYDDEALTFTQVDDFSEEIFAASSSLPLIPRMTVWKNDNNLYLNFYDRASGAVAPDTVLQYTRGQKGFIAPNKLSGLPADRLVSVTHTLGGLNYLFAFGAGPPGSGNRGQVLAWDGQGWHPLYTPPAAGGSVVIGGGYAHGTLYTALANGRVVAQPYGDNRIRPEFRSDAYETGVTRPMAWARTTGGTDLLKKTELWATIVSRKKVTDGGGARTLPFGLNSGCELDVYRRLDGGSWVALGTLTSASPFPAQLDLATKANWYELELRIDGRSADSANTQILGKPQLHFDRTPQDVRDVYDFVIDPAAALDSPFPGEHGRDAAAIVAELMALRGKMVTLEAGAGAWGGRPGTTTVACGLFQMAMELDPQTGTVLARCECRDYSTPSSG